MTEYANWTATPMHARCPSEISIGGLRLRCGMVADHRNPHGVALTDYQLQGDRTAYVTVNWITNPDDRKGALSSADRMEEAGS